MKLHEVDLGLGGGRLLQVANRSLSQMMSYVIESSDGKIIVIDGGHYCKEDAEHLYQLLMSKGGRVDLWLLTHAHVDHYGALMWLMENRQIVDLHIEKLCYHFPSREWLASKEGSANISKFFSYVDQLNLCIEVPHAGDVMTFGDVSLEIVSHPEEYENYSINATSLVILVHFPKKDVLFLADLDTSGQADFLRKIDVSKIRKDIVQMAHHGQHGVDRSFYELVQPKVCLYPAPEWLWENNQFKCEDPASAGTGPFTTLETRRWMEEMGVTKSYTHAEGDYLFT